MTSESLDEFGYPENIAPPARPPNDRINIINTGTLLHLTDLYDTLDFSSSMFSRTTGRSFLPNTITIPVGIVIIVSVIVAGPA
jgi:hypothetical protein